MPYCKKCGEELPEDALFCPNCGASIKVSDRTPVAKPRQRVALSVPRTARVAKSPRTAALLAAIVGFVAILGAGHLYVGKRKAIMAGVGFMILGFMFSIPIAVNLINPPPRGPSWEIIGIFWLIWLGLWIWQIFDARKLAKAS